MKFKPYKTSKSPAISHVDMQVNVGDMTGVSKSMSCITIRRVTQATARIPCQHIYFPATAEQCSHVMRGFYAIVSLPGVLGVVDCTHIPLQSPGGESAELVPNGKGYYSALHPCENVLYGE